MEPTIALLGPPGSGKGTQAERLRPLGFTTLSTGELLRDARAAGTELGARAAGYMDRGELIPDDVMVAALCEAIDGLDGDRIVLDGFPRTVAQAEALEERGRELGAAVLIDVPDDVVVERMSGRGREDDRPDTVRERLRVYHRETEPLIEYYDRRGLLRRVDGSAEPDAVHEQVREALAA